MEGEVDGMKVFCRLVHTILQWETTTMMKRFERPGFLSSVSGLLVSGDSGSLWAGAGGCPCALGCPSPVLPLIPGRPVLSTCRESQWLCGDDGGRCVERYSYYTCDCDLTAFDGPYCNHGQCCWLWEE